MSETPPVTPPDPNAIPIIVEEKRQQKRRATDHSPHDCFKLIEFQATVDDIQRQLKEGAISRAALTADVTQIKASLNDGSSRMEAIEGSVSGVKATVERGASSHARVEENLAANTEKTNEVWEVVQTFKGIGRVCAAIGRGFRKFMIFVGWLAGILAPVAVLYYAVRDGIKG